MRSGTGRTRNKKLAKVQAQTCVKLPASGSSAGCYPKNMTHTGAFVL